MSRVNEIKKYIKIKGDMDYVGICSSKMLEGEPAGHRPSDLLPTARSIIVFGRRMTNGAVSAAFRRAEDFRITALSAYADHCCNLSANFLMLNDVYNISQYIERTFKACVTPLTFGSTQNVEPEEYYLPFFANPYKAGLPIDIARAAVAAGIGELAWNHRIVTEADGPRINLAAVLTDMEFEEYDIPYSGKKLCDPSICRICSNVCPTKAILPKDEDEGYDIKVGDNTYPVGHLDCNACAVACMGLKKEFFGIAPSVDAVSGYHPDDDEMKTAFDKMRIDGGLGVEHFPQYYCDKCLIYCPLGGWKEKFSDTNLSRFDGKEVPKPMMGNMSGGKPGDKGKQAGFLNGQSAGVIPGGSDGRMDIWADGPEKKEGAGEK